MSTAGGPANPPEQNAEKIADRPILPRLLLGIFALGSVTIVASVGYISHRDWRDFVAMARTELARYPIVEAELGTIEEIEIDVPASRATGGESTVVLDLTGDRGRGTVTAEVLTLAGRQVLRIEGNLVLSDGIVHRLVPAEPAGAGGTEPVAPPGG